MTNIARPSEFRQLREAREALFRPAPASERFDPEHPITMRCAACGKFAYGPRRLMQEAIREHKQHECPKRNTNPDPVTRIFFPRA